MRPILLCALALGWSLFAGASRAQEEEAAVDDYFLDEQTELTLTSHLKDPKTWSVELRQYGDATQGVIFTFAGDVRLLTKGVYEWKGDAGPSQKIFRIVGQPGDKSPLEVSTRYLVADVAKPTRSLGKFKWVEPIMREVRTKERFEKADKAFNELLTRTLSEVGKPGEPKLREAQTERLKLRDTLAVAAVGGPEEPKVGMAYWTSLWTSTLDNIAFLKCYTGRAVAKGLAGSYRMANGNSLELEMPEDGLKFTATVLHPADAKPGTITGTARLAGTRAVYKEALSKKETEGREPAEVVLTQHAGHIVRVEAKNTGEFGGADVSFEGDYYKVAPRK